MSTTSEARIERYIAKVDAFDRSLLKFEGQMERIAVRIEEKVDTLTTRIHDLHLEVRAVSPELVAQQGRDIEELKRQMARFAGLIFGLGLGSGAIGGSAAMALLRTLLS